LNRREPERRVRRNPTLPQHNLVQAVQRDAETTRRLNLTKPRGLRNSSRRTSPGANCRTQPVRIPSDRLRHGLCRHCPASS
jgi:hypothetical protein